MAGSRFGKYRKFYGQRILLEWRLLRADFFGNRIIKSRLFVLSYVDGPYIMICWLSINTEHVGRHRSTKNFLVR